MNKFISNGTVIAGAYVMSGLLLGVITFASNMPSTVAASNQTKLECFSGLRDPYGYGGDCVTLNGTLGPAIFKNTDANAGGDYSGVYIADTALVGQSLENITQLGFDYAGNITPEPWSLSLNIPVDTDGDNQTDTYLFFDTYYCPGIAGSVDIIRDANCVIFVNDTEYANWAALLAAHPTWKVLVDNALLFMDAERTHAQPEMVWSVTNIQLGSAGK